MNETTSIIFGHLKGKAIAYCNQTQFLVQIGKGSKGGYKTKYAIIGNLCQAVMYYNGINIGNGYKKRLFMPACSRNPVLAKEKS